MEIRVVKKKRKHPSAPWIFYIGRPSPLGNPYEIGIHGSRTEVIEKYKKLLEDSLKDPLSKMSQAIGDIELILKGYGKAELVCWCKPLACHGDVIKSVLEARVKDIPG